MARGNQRELSREKNLKKKATADKGASHSAPKAGGVNSDKDALAAKVAAKQKAKEDAAAAGIETTIDRGANYVAKEKVVNAVNPHTGKKDAKFNAKLHAKEDVPGAKKAGGTQKKKKGTSVAATGLPPELAAAMAAGKKKKKKSALGTAQGAAAKKVGK
jgi:hypothetical protein